MFYARASIGQEGIIKGKLIDSESNESVAFAAVSLISAMDSSFVKGEIADSLGNFEFIVSYGYYMLSISSLRHKRFISVPFNIDQVHSVIEMFTLRLVPNSTVLQEAVVHGERPAFERKFDKVVINVNSATLFRASSNLKEILEKSPGVKVTIDGDILLRNNISPMVLIDGKPVPMSKEELNVFLNSLPKEQIEAIEIQENPSVRYDGEYKGVVDIKLKKDSSLGWNGNISVYGARNSLISAGGGATTNYKAKKISYFGTYRYSNNRHEFRNEGTQYLESKQELRSLLEIPLNKKAHNYQFGVDYAASKSQALSLLIKGFNNSENNLSSSVTALTTPGSTTGYSSVATRNAQRPTNDNYTGNVSYRGDLKKGTVNVDAAYANYHTSQSQKIENYLSDKLSEHVRSDTKTRIQIKALQLDYTLKIGNGRADLGGKVAETSSRNNLSFDTLSSHGMWLTDLRRSNRFEYNEDVLSAYLSYFQGISTSLDVQGGIRMERTNANGYSFNNNTVFERKYLKVLPSLKAAYQFTKNSLMVFSYTRRIERPSFYYLNPFVMYLSPYMYTEGNPFLLPTTNNLASLSFSHNNLSSSFNYRREFDIVSQVPYLDSATKVTLYTRENTGSKTNVSWDVSYGSAVTKWLRVQNFLNLQYLNQKFQYIGTRKNVKQLSVSLNGNGVFTLGRNYTFELSYSYNSRSKSYIYDIGSAYQINCALRKTFFDKQLDMQISFNDLLFSANPKISSHMSDFDAKFYQTYDTRSARLQVVYKFGKSAYQRKEKKSSGADEENRAKN